MQQGEPNQLYLKLHLGECGEHILHEKWIILAGEFSIETLVKNVTRFVLSSLECIYMHDPACFQYVWIIIRSGNTGVLLLSVHYFSRGQLLAICMYGGHTGKERYIPRHLIANKISPSICECLPVVQLLSGCATTCSVNRKGKRPTQNGLHVQTCYQIKKTFHEYSLDDSVDVARSYALLLYGKKGRDVDTFDELR